MTAGRLALIVSFVSAALPLSLAAENHLVVPFANLGGDGNLDWIGESIAGAISESLTAAGVAVIPRSDRNEALARLGIRSPVPLSSATAIKLAKSLDVEWLVYGRFEVAAGGAGEDNTRRSLRIEGRLLNTKSLYQKAACEELGPLDDLMRLQSLVAWEMLREVRNRRAPPREEFLDSRPKVRLDALENYMRGLLAQSPEQKHRYFALAARLDPDFSRPLFQLGRMQWESESYRVAAGWLEKVPPSDPNYLEATFLLGISRFYVSDYEGALASFSMLAGRMPLPEVFNNLGAAQSRLGRAEALESFLKALEADPADPVYHFNAGHALWKRGEFPSAAERFRAALDREPEEQEAMMMLGRALSGSGPRLGDHRAEGLERLKEDFEELAWRQMKLKGSGGE